MTIKIALERIKEIVERLPEKWVITLIVALYIVGLLARLIISARIQIYKSIFLKIFEDDK